MMGRRLAEQGADVELMISSPAVRALATAEAMAEELGYPWDEIVADERLYEADTEAILAVIEEQDDWIDCLMLIGHNPGLTALANYLSPLNIDNVPTAGLVHLWYDMKRWTELAVMKPARVTFDYPKRRQE